jgi:hypothetical protein
MDRDTATPPAALAGRLVFIVGAPRSGTTLLRVLLNRHPAFGLCDETYFGYYVYGRRRVFGDLSDPQLRALAIRKYLETHRMQRLGLDLGQLASQLQSAGTSYRAFLATILHAYAESMSKPRGGEKTPHHAWLAPTLMDWFPSAKVIHLVRDPRDVAASLRHVAWGPRDSVRAARLWTELVLAAEACAGRPNFRTVRYADLVADTERTLAELCAFLGEEFVPAMLHPDANAKVDLPWFERAHGPLVADRQGLWRRELSPQDASLIEWIAGPLLTRFGLEVTGASPTYLERAFGIMRCHLEELSTRVTHARAMWYRWFRPAELAAEERWIDA